MRKRQWTREEKVMVRVGLVVVIGANIIFIIDFYLLENFLFGPLNLRQGMPLFAGFRTLLAVIYVIGFLPASILGEWADSWVKQRSFRPRNVLILLLLLGEFVLVAAGMLTLFDAFLSETSIYVQIPMMAVVLGTSTLMVAANSKIKRINDFVKRAFG